MIGASETPDRAKKSGVMCLAWKSPPTIRSPFPLVTPQEAFSLIPFPPPNPRSHALTLPLDGLVRPRLRRVIENLE